MQVNMRLRMAWGLAGLMGMMRVALTGAVDNICWMQFMQADNKLEPSLMKDHSELLQSEAITQDNVITWVYFDYFDNVGKPLSNIWKKDGTPVEFKTSGSMYLTYNHDTSKMEVDSVLPGEQNGDSPSTLDNFLIRALTDCVSKDAEEYMLILEAYGAGFAGFGGDDNQRRRLIQTNSNIVSAIENALSYVAGAPNKLDVIGFNADIMMSFLALKTYSPITKYFLASEATIPEHGFAYDKIDTAVNALDMARKIQSTYISDLHGYNFHKTPKTLGIVDTEEFEIFSRNFEKLVEAFTNIIRISEDPNFNIQLERTREASISMTSYLDHLGSVSPSAVDIGNFLANFRQICQPARSSDINRLLNQALSSYKNMFVDHGTGPGTDPFTGMHVLWPSKTRYVVSKDLLRSFMFSRSSIGRNASMKWTQFVAAFLTGENDLKTSSVEESVCGQTSISVHAPLVTGELLLRPNVTETANEIYLITDLATSTDWVYVEYGFDATSKISTLERRRLLEEIPSSPKFNHPHFNWKEQTSHRSLLRGDYLHVFMGANLRGIYKGPKYGVSWSKNIYGIKTENKQEFFYLQYKGGNSVVMPVIYFPKEAGVTEYNILKGTSAEQALNRGGMFGELSFGFDPDSLAIGSDVTLIVQEGNAENEQSPMYEVPRSAGGSIMPLIRVQGRIDRQPFDFALVGGWNLAFFDWSNKTKLIPFRQTAKEFLEAEGLSDAIVEIRAFDFDLYNEYMDAFWSDSESYFINVVDNSGSKITTRQYTSPRGFAGNTTGFSGASCLTSNRVFLMGLGVILSTFLSLI